jgi:tRNA threonylcarbamoyladenosine biosynthesis protein TsaE
MSLPTLSYPLPDLPQIAQKLLAQYAHKNIWLFDAEMGSGKTTLIKAICEQLGVQDHISSPTYALVNEYHTDKPITIYHIDLYRLKNLEEALHIGIEDYLYQPNSYCFIEWYALIKPILPPQCLLIQIERLPDGNRQLTSSIL